MIEEEIWILSPCTEVTPLNQKFGNQPLYRNQTIQSETWNPANWITNLESSSDICNPALCIVGRFNGKFGKQSLASTSLFYRSQTICSEILNPADSIRNFNIKFIAHPALQPPNRQMYQLHNVCQSFMLYCMFYIFSSLGVPCTKSMAVSKHTIYSH